MHELRGLRSAFVLLMGLEEFWIWSSIVMLECSEKEVCLYLSCRKTQEFCIYK